VQEEGSLPSERSGEGGAKRRSAQAKRGRLGCLSGRLGFLALRGAHEYFFVVVLGSTLRAEAGLQRIGGKWKVSYGRGGKLQKCRLRRHVSEMPVIRPGGLDL
jgi:hypothetical protein